MSKAEDLVAEIETGARQPKGHAGRILWGIPLVWSLFQLWYASPFPYMLGVGVLNSTEARAIHLGFAIFLAYTAYPALKRSPRDRIPAVDWIVAIVATFCATYLFSFYRELADRPGLPTTQDVVVSAVGMVLLLEATRRALGPPLMVVCAVFLFYVFAGPYMPDVIAYKGASLNKAASHFWLGTEGVYGVALGVSTSMVFLFVLFGALMERAGMGNYFIMTAFALMGHMRGGPAKAAVVSSGLSGVISGSSIANVVTTGTFTIPLMKKVGFSAEKAGAVEVASSTNGQLMPPVMGAAAFLMVEYVGISYIEVIKHAFLPAIISYIALVYIVHLEALKADIRGLPKVWLVSWPQKMLSYGTVLLGFVILSGIVYYGLGWTKDVAGDATPYIAAAVMVVAYVFLLRIAASQPDLPDGREIDHLPMPGPTVKAGLHYLLPVGVLVWCLAVERLSPGLAAFWAVMFQVFIQVTQRPLFAFFRAETDFLGPIRRGLEDLIEALVSGGRNMVGIGVATAAAGVVVGTVSLTGIGQVLIEVIELLSGGSLIIMLFLTAVISLILGMGLPTTANYIVVSTLMAPVIVTLGAENGLIVPLIAAHMFVFYFGILADDTPPVGLAAFAAAAISGGDPIKTGVQGFTYDIRTAILPFLFIFNTQLLLIGIDTAFDLILTVVSAVIAMLAFAAATQGYVFVKTKLWETVALLMITFTLFRPGYWMDMVYEPFVEVAGTEIYAVAETVSPGEQLRVRVTGENFDGKLVDKVVMLPMGEGSGLERVLGTGLTLEQRDGKMIVEDIGFDTVADKLKIDFDWELATVIKKSDRPAAEWFFIPAFLLLSMVLIAQRRRRKLADL